MIILTHIPDYLKQGLLDFLAAIPVEKSSQDWQAIQNAISMIANPGSIKKGHVYLFSGEGDMGPHYYNTKRMYVKISPRKIRMRFEHYEFGSGLSLDVNKDYKYEFPDDNYKESDFYKIMSNIGDLYKNQYIEDDSNGEVKQRLITNFYIDT